MKEEAVVVSWALLLRSTSGGVTAAKVTLDDRLLVLDKHGLGERPEVACSVEVSRREGKKKILE